jgi:hypothetical protein
MNIKKYSKKRMPTARRLVLSNLLYFLIGSCKGVWQKI